MTKVAQTGLFAPGENQKLLTGMEIVNFAPSCWDLVLTHFVGDEQKTEAWFNTNNPMLGEQSPASMLLIGRKEKLERIIAQAIEGVLC